MRLSLTARDASQLPLPWDENQILHDRMNQSRFIGSESRCISVKLTHNGLAMAAWHLRAIDATSDRGKQ